MFSEETYQKHIVVQWFLLSRCTNAFPMSQGMFFWFKNTRLFNDFVSPCPMYAWIAFFPIWRCSAKMLNISISVFGRNTPTHTLSFNDLCSPDAPMHARCAKEWFLLFKYDCWNSNCFEKNWKRLWNINEERFINISQKTKKYEFELYLVRFDDKKLSKYP